MHGEQEGASYNGHFGSMCYHPLFVFNQFGDCEGAKLRAGNVHSAHEWRQVLEKILSRYEEKGVLHQTTSHLDQLDLHAPQRPVPDRLGQT